jgi:adenosylcobinamide kinase/adenosylcobinamide-phosphate guanylyltransferase
MTALVIGGASSGKSEFAEKLAMTGKSYKYYIATMEPFGPEEQKRVKRHREMRRGKGFVTCERYTNLADMVIPNHGTALIECVGNLVANEIFSPKGAKLDTLGEVLRGVDVIAHKCDDVIAVTNDVFCDGAWYSGETTAYIKTLGAVNAALAASFDIVVETVAGIPIVLKGGAALDRLGVR